MITEGNKILLREEKIKNDVALKKLEKKLQKTQDEIDYAEIEEYIKIEYPDGLDIVKDRKLIKDGVKKIIPLKCRDCEIIKVFPYDFTALNGRDYQSNRCKICTEIINKPCKKYQENHKIICDCGICYVGTELSIAKHRASQQHKDRMGEMIFGIRYTQKELISLSQHFKVPYYKKLTKDEMKKELVPKLAYDLNKAYETDKGKAIIEENEKRTKAGDIIISHKCIVISKDKTMLNMGTHKWEEYENVGEGDVLVSEIYMNVPEPTKNEN